MSETNKSDERQDRSSDDILPEVETNQNDSEREPGLRDQIHKFIASAQDKKSPTRQQLSKDRTRSLTLLIAGIVGVDPPFYRPIFDAANAGSAKTVVMLDRISGDQVLVNRRPMWRPGQLLHC